MIKWNVSADKNVIYQFNKYKTKHINYVIIYVSFFNIIYKLINIFIIIG